MKHKSFLKWLSLSALFSVSFVVKAADDAYAYKMLSFNDGSDNFDGWIRTDGTNSKTYSSRLPENYSKIGLTCWAFSMYAWSNMGESCFPHQFPSSIEVKKDSQSEWNHVTIKDKYFFNIPEGYDQIRVTFGYSAPMIMTLGEPIKETEEIKLTEFPEMDILVGTLTGRGILAEGEQNKVVEISIPCTSAAGLSQAFASITHSSFYVKENADAGYRFIQAIGPTSLSATAVTTDNRNVAMPLYGISKSSVSSAELACLLPKNIAAIRIRWEFEDVPSYPTETGIDYYYPVYVRSNPSDGALEECECEFLVITQAAGPGNETVAVSKDLRLATDAAVWYDIDGDGVKEWVVDSYDKYEGNTYKKYGGLSKFNADYAGCLSLNNKFPSISGWVKYSPAHDMMVYSKDPKKSMIYTVNGTEATLVTETAHTPALLDFNNDGSPDFWLDSGNVGRATPDHILTADANGVLQTENLVTITPNEYYNYVISKPSSGLGSGLSFVGDTPDKSKTPGTFSTYDLIDLNNDGYLDFVNGTTGRYLLNTGDGRYMDDTFGGTVVFRDFDGDGITDMLSYDDSEKSISVYLQRFDGNTVTRQLFKGLKCGKQVWCRDFDRDGDIDILVPFNGSDNGGQSYLVMFENTGNGNFKKHENFIDGGYDFHALTDWNADGKYEILSVSSEHPVKSFAVNGMKVASTPQDLGSLSVSINEYSKTYELLTGDVDNSGRTRIISTHGMLTPETSQRNSRPQAPAAPVAVYDAKSEILTVSWATANDRETAPADLTYELRIGTADGLGDIVYAHASADGKRLNMLQGNCGYSLHRRFNTSSWPQGKIYVSVQAIDDGGLGSEFSQPAMFEKRHPAASFSITTPDILAVGDRLTLRVTSALTDGLNASWNLDGATVIAESDAETVISYSSPGKKEITLTVTDAAGNSSSHQRTVDIAPAKVTPYPHDSAGLPFYGILAAFDMDLDGKTELMASPDNGQAFYEGDENGTYTPVKRLFNTSVDCSFNGQIPQIVDINRDGLPDIFARGYDGSSYIAHFINEDDKSMQYNRTNIEYDGVDIKKPMVDFDNDGLKDYPLARNSGDYLTFTDELHWSLGYNAHYTDLNGDGLVDIITVETDKMTQYVNRGNFQFEVIKTVEDERLTTYGYLGDFDGNGKDDYAWCQLSKYTYYCDFLLVRWDDGSTTEIPAPDGTQFTGIHAMFDFDNNGCQDIIVKTRSDYNVMILFNPDHTYETVRISDPDMDNLSYLRTDGRIGLGHTIITCKPNTPPTAPTGLRVSQNSNAVVIEWNRATDNETPSTVLRYNISVKKAGAEGEGAYHISPLNGGKNGVPVPSNVHLLPSTMLTIPLSSIAEGEYEVKIQAVDTQLLQGDFSETVKFSVVANAAVDMPTATMVGAPIQVRINAGFSVADIDFGTDAQIESATGNTATVYWTTEGLKEVKAGKLVSQIYVNPRLDASFSLPETIYEGDRVIMNCDNTHPDLWEASTGFLEQHIYFKPVSDIPAVSVQAIDDHTAELCITGMAGGTWNLRHSITESYGSDVYRVQVRATRHPEMPAISLVDIDETTGKHRLSWNLPAHLQDIATHVNIYKETSRTGEYRIVAECPVTETDYVDNESTPAVVASRYALSFGTSYGETVMSGLHRPIHVMINKGAASNSWNLSWGKYEGREITSYRILRGTSAESLEYIDEVSGGISSYTDFSAPAGECYYAIEVLIDSPAMLTPKQTPAHSRTASRSNVVSTADAGSVVFASGISISSETGSFNITATESVTLQLLAQISPANVSIHRVDWIVISGSDVVTVNENGVVTAIGNGSAVIAAYATDGSGVYGEATVTVNDFSGIENVVTEKANGKLSITRTDTEIEISGIEADETHPAIIRIYNTSGVLLKMLSSSGRSKRVNISGLPNGVYIVSSHSSQSLQSGRFIVR